MKLRIKDEGREGGSMELLLIALFALVGVVQIWMSGRQPFPEVSRQFGSAMLLVTVFFLMANQAPHPPSLFFILISMTAAGGIGVVIGVRHLAMTHKDVIVAPFAGALMGVGATGLLVIEWSNFTTIFEQVTSFILICLLGVLEVYLVFRGLLIGKLSRSWSQAGLRQLQRGLIEGEKGALGCFEKAWDIEDEHLNPMAYIALQRIHTHLGNDTEAAEWGERLQEFGGESAVAEEWVGAIESALPRG